MIKPGVPEDEPARLSTLRALNILDSAPEERFDRLTRLAKRLFGVPIALVSLVDENRQWFKSCVGLDASETSREISFCGHAILGDGIFEVPDALVDERFHDNPLVTDAPHIRFYAGVPLRIPTGSKLGTLCIIDREPRALDEEEQALLKDLARMAEQELAAIQLATLDELTLISNRRGFLSLAKHALSVCIRNGIPASLVYLDLDGFKPINDRFGHAEGDLALQVFAEQMRSIFRDSDVIGRMGGDEFVALLTNATPEVCQNAISRLRSALDAHNAEAKRGYDIRFSAGLIALDPARHSNVSDLLEEADQLMLDRKRAKGASR